MYTQIILSGALDRLGKQILELSDVTRLFEYDRQNQTNYLRTLERYLLHGNKLSRAASSMFVDRSTMKYRLRKIKGMIQQDFEDPDAAKRLLAGIAVFKASLRGTNIEEDI
jgi:DNA-binding PucR family transcriptional regulator